MPRAEQAASVWIVPALKRKIATIAASDRMSAHGLMLANIGMSKPSPCQRSGTVSRKIVCQANQIARFRITPPTAAVMGRIGAGRTVALADDKSRRTGARADKANDARRQHDERERHIAEKDRDK